MKRSLLSLAAMAVAGNAPAQPSVSLFGRVDLTPRPPARITLEPSEAFWAGLDVAAPRADSEVVVVGSVQAGKTMRLHWYQEEALAAMRKHASAAMLWPYVA